jgi:uncharacterized RDD family membrane protein YckC
MMSDQARQLAEKGIPIHAQLTSNLSVLICTDQELFAWNDQHLKRINLLTITKVGFENGDLIISSKDGMPVQLPFQGTKEELSQFFATVKYVTKTLRQVPTTQTPSASEPIISPKSPSLAKVIPAQQTAEPKIRLSDYGDPLASLPEIVKPVSIPNKTIEKNIEKSLDARTASREELGFAFDFAPFGQRLLAFIIDIFILGIFSRIADFMVLNGPRFRQSRILELREKIELSATDPNYDFDKYLAHDAEIKQLIVTLPGEFVLGTIMVSVVTLIAGWLYFAILESSERQGTIGKQILKIGVCDLTVNRIDFKRATRRYFYRNAPIAVGLTATIGVVAPWIANRSSGAALQSGLLTAYAMLAIGLLFTLVMYVWAFANRSHQTLYDLWAKTLVIKG